MIGFAGIVVSVVGSYLAADYTEIVNGAVVCFWITSFLSGLMVFK